MEPMEWTTKSVDETHEAARKLIEMLEKKQNQATIVGLYGDLGSGKTTFVQGVAKALGVRETVISPTFIIERVYKLEGYFRHFIHIDCYRFEDSNEIKTLGLDEVLKDPRALLCIEWADKVEKFLPEGITKIYFELVDENTRKINIISV